MLTLLPCFLLFVDWIAHGIMDSIVDSFFPFLGEIDKEVTDIEALVYSNGAATPATASQDPISPISPSNSSGSDTVVLVSEKMEKILSGSGGEEKLKENSDRVGDKKEMEMKGKEKEDGNGSVVNHDSPAAKTRFSLPSHRRRISFHFSFGSVMQWVGVVKALLQRRVQGRKFGPGMMMTGNVHRMARARRLVTSLTRFLHMKSEVVAQIKKRLLKTGEFGLGNGTGDDQDVFMYMGDIQGMSFLPFFTIQSIFWISSKLLREYNVDRLWYFYRSYPRSSTVTRSLRTSTRPIPPRLPHPTPFLSLIRQIRKRQSRSPTNNSIPRSSMCSNSHRSLFHERKRPNKRPFHKQQIQCVWLYYCGRSVDCVWVFGCGLVVVVAGEEEAG